MIFPNYIKDITSFDEWLNQNVKDDMLPEKFSFRVSGGYGDIIETYKVKDEYRVDCTPHGGYNRFTEELVKKNLDSGLWVIVEKENIMKLTPFEEFCKEHGYKTTDKFIVHPKSGRTTCHPDGTIVQLHGDACTGCGCPSFMDSAKTDYFYYGFDELEHYETEENNQKPRKHADLIIAWANGAEIQFLDCVTEWTDVSIPLWDNDTEYRLKPKEERKLELNFSVNEKQAKLLLVALNASRNNMRRQDQSWKFGEYDLCTEPFWTCKNSLSSQLKEFLGVE